MRTVSVAPASPRVLLAVPAVARAQGTLSTQGFGYPAGQISTRSLGAGGAHRRVRSALVDQSRRRSRASAAAALYVQAEPEYRSSDGRRRRQRRRSIARHPLVTVAFRCERTSCAGLSALEPARPQLRDERARHAAASATRHVATTNFFKSDGAIGDVRLALAWAPRRWLGSASAAHAITGDNRLRSSQRFDDSTRFARAHRHVDGRRTSAPRSRRASTLFVRRAVGLRRVVPEGRLDVGEARRHDARQARTCPTACRSALAYLGIHGHDDRRAHVEGRRGRACAGSDRRRCRSPTSWDTSVGADVLGPRLGPARYPAARGRALAHASLRPGRQSR